MIIRLLKPWTSVVDGDNGKVFRLDLVDVGLVSNGDTRTLDVCRVWRPPRVDCMHCASAIGGIGGAGLAGVNGGVSLSWFGRIPIIERSQLMHWSRSSAAYFD